MITRQDKSIINCQFLCGVSKTLGLKVHFFCLLLTHFLGDWSQSKKLSEIKPPLAQHLQYLTDINATEELRCMKIICSIDHSCTICLKTYCAAPFAALVNQFHPFDKRKNSLFCLHYHYYLLIKINLALNSIEPVSNHLIISCF